MQSLPKRCQHIKTNGTQCGSPALHNEPMCHFHKENPHKKVEFVGGSFDRLAVSTITLAPFEDAHAIQSALRRVTEHLLEGNMNPKTAGLVLYALQIASSNLKRMSDEKPQPAEVVLELDKIAETPVVMTPSSTNGSGKAPERHTQKSDRKKKDEAAAENTKRGLDYLLYLGQHLDTPTGTPEVEAELERLRKRYEEPENVGESDDGLPPGTIQACVPRRRKKEYVI